MTDYYSVLTRRGKALEALAAASSTPVVLKDFVVGDGNGETVMPDAEQTRLVNEVYRGTISSLVVSPEQENQFIAFLTLPASTGGFTVREVGLLTEKGELYAVANCAAIEKPQRGVSVNMQFRLAVSETAQIELNVATGDGLFLRQDANLSDVNDKNKARDNLGLKGAALLDVGKVQDTVAAGDDERIVNALNRKTGGTVEKSLTVKNVLSLGSDGNGVFSGDTPGINIGDTDSGLLSAGDGALAVYSNNVRIGWLDGAGLHINGLHVSGGTLQMIGDDRKHIRFGNNDGTSRMYIYKDKNGDGIHITNANDGGGDFVFHRNGEFYAPQKLHAGGAVVHPDGNIQGSCWGDYLSNWIIARINSAIANRATWDWVNLNFITAVRLGAVGWYTAIQGNNTVMPPGHVVVGGRNNGTSNLAGLGFAFAPLQFLINGVWYTAGGA